MARNDKSTDTNGNTSTPKTKEQYKAQYKEAQAKQKAARAQLREARKQMRDAERGLTESLLSDAE